MGFKPGEIANPEGRGHSPNKLTAKAREQAFRALELAGRWSDAEFSEWLKDNPAALTALMGKSMTEHHKLDAKVEEVRNPIAESLKRLVDKQKPDA
jgi:hypothetical protein